MAVYHRVESPTQTIEDAVAQEATGEIWGRTPRSGAMPAVQAYEGPLPAGSRGVEFETAVAPEPGSPPGRAVWRGPRRGVEVRGDFAILSVTVVSNRQAEENV